MTEEEIVELRSKRCVWRAERGITRLPGEVEAVAIGDGAQESKGASERGGRRNVEKGVVEAKSG